MSNLVYNQAYQNLHLDRAKADSMKYVNLSFPNALPSSATPKLLYQYEHGYGYRPQFWGLWDIQYNAGLGGNARRGYGHMSNNTGFGLNADFYYTVDSVYVKLYLLYYGPFVAPPSIVGTTAKFTGYLFANDIENQDYTA